MYFSNYFLMTCEINKNNFNEWVNKNKDLNWPS